LVDESGREDRNPLEQGRNAMPAIDADSGYVGARAMACRQLVAVENLRATRLPTASVTETVVVWTTSCQACLLN
jgi:hypothetical protein